MTVVNAEGPTTDDRDAPRVLGPLASRALHAVVTASIDALLFIPTGVGPWRRARG